MNTKYYWLLSAYLIGVGLYSTGCTRYGLSRPVGSASHAKSCDKVAKKIILLEESAMDQGVSTSCFGGSYGIGSIVSRGAAQRRGNITRFGVDTSVSASSISGSSCSSSSNSVDALKVRRKMLWLYRDSQCSEDRLVMLRELSE